MQSAISILPSDERMEYLAGYISKKGGKICHSYAEIDDSGYIICGVPFSKDGVLLNTSLDPHLPIDSFLGMLNSSHTIVGGNLPREVISYCTTHSIRYYDVLSSDDLSVKNARLTAEGLLIPLLSETSFSICDFKTLITGFGKCGKEIADILSVFTDEIYIYDTDQKAIKSAKSRGFITISKKEIHEKYNLFHEINTMINTVPDNPFTENTWRRLPEDCIIFNIASVPLQPPVPFTHPVISCPGIPGNYAPKTAGTLIAKEICRHFNL